MLPGKRLQNVHHLSTRLITWGEQEEGDKKLKHSTSHKVGKCRKSKSISNVMDRALN